MTPVLMLLQILCFHRQSRSHRQMLRLIASEFKFIGPVVAAVRSGGTAQSVVMNTDQVFPETALPSRREKLDISRLAYIHDDG